MVEGASRVSYPPDRIRATGFSAVSPEGVIDRLRNIQGRIGLRVRETSTFSTGLPLDLNVFRGRYRILKKIAQTSISSVYQAREDGTQRVVAIKLANNLHTKALVEREGKILKQLSHPNIVRCLEQGEDYLILEFLEGIEFYRLRLSAEEVMLVAFNMLEAFEEVHRRQLVIRDIKDDHVMVSPAGEGKLFDFNLVRDLRSAEDIGPPRQVWATPEFAAPEAIERGSGFATKESDYYSLGVMLYRALTGRLPQERLAIFPANKWGRVSFPEIGPTLNFEQLKPVPPKFRPLLIALTERNPRQRLADPLAAQKMILEALFGV